MAAMTTPVTRPQGGRRTAAILSQELLSALSEGADGFTIWSSTKLQNPLVD